MVARRASARTARRSAFCNPTDALRCPAWRLCSPRQPAKPRPAGAPPVMHLVKKVLDALHEAAPAALTASALREACGVDLAADPEVAAAVAANPKATYDAAAGKYSYRATFAVASKAEILKLLVSRPEGTSRRALADAYAAAGDDVAELVEEGAAWAVDNLATGDAAVYPRDKSYELPVDERIKAIWSRCEIPTEPDAFAAELARAGIAPAPRRSTFARRVMPLNTQERKVKRKRDFSKLHVTNVHLWDELFAPGAADDLPEED